jgi:hypothetical protein
LMVILMTVLLVQLPFGHCFKRAWRGVVLQGMVVMQGDSSCVFITQEYIFNS